MKSFEYFYDVSSPYAYLAHAAVNELAAAHQATVVWRPFFLGGLFKSLESTIVPFNSGSANKQAILRADMYRWAELHAVPFAWPSRFPMMTVKAMRLLTTLSGEEHVRAATAIFRAYWADDRDISDAAVLREVLAGAGLPADELLTKADLPEVKQALIDATDEAKRRGACGAPTFFVGEHVVWGQDRLDHVARLLDGWRPRHG
jgi:2-hydroxychromene-2-carboxylate isomerase